MHVRHHCRDTILHQRNRSCESTHRFPIIHIRHVAVRYLHFSAYSPDIARCVVLRRRCPSVDEVSYRAAAVQSSVVLKQLDECPVPVSHAPELAERLVLRRPHFPLPQGARQPDVTRVIVPQSPCFHLLVPFQGYRRQPQLPPSFPRTRQLAASSAL